MTAAADRGGERHLAFLPVAFLPALLLWICAAAPVPCSAGQQVTYGCPQDQVLQAFLQVAKELGGQVEKIDEHTVRLKVMDSGLILRFEPVGKDSTRLNVDVHSGDRAKGATVQRLLLNLVNSRLAKSQGPRPRGSSPSVRRFTRATVCIFGTKDGNSLQSSGFFVSSKGLVLTTGHELETGMDLVIQLHDGTVGQGKVIAMDRRFDLCAISTGFHTRDFIVVHPADMTGIPETGTTVWALGCPLGLSETSARGIITAPPRLLGGTMLFQSDLPAYPGSSGSPVFDSRGRLLGMVKGRIRGIPKISFLIPGFYLRSFLFRLGSDVKELTVLGKEGGTQGADAWLVRALAARNYRDKEFALLRALQLDPDFEPALYHLGMVYAAMPGKIKVEEKIWRRLVRLEPRWGEARFRLGNCLLRQERLEDAVRAYRQALGFLGEDPRVYNNLGEALRRLGRIDEARKALRTALSYNPDYAPAHFNLGVLYEEDLKEPERAIYHYRRYLALRPDAQDARKVRAWIEKLEAGL